MYDTKELDEALYALAKVMNSGKASFDDDGQLTFSDAFNFVDDVVPVWNGIAGAQLIIVNINQITAEQKQASKDAFFAELDYSPEDEAAFDNVLTLLFSLIAVLTSFNVLPAVVPAPVVTEAPIEEGSEDKVEEESTEEVADANVDETPSTDEQPADTLPSEE